MFGFFRINDPYRIIIIFFLLIIISLPYFLSGKAQTIPELEWMIVGEKMSEGASLYIGVWDDLSPLSAGVYWLIDEVFGRSQLTYQILSLLLIIVQGAIFNSIMLSHKVYHENTYAPALIYATLMTLSFDFLTLSPVLMSMTFILLALNLLLQYIQRYQKSDDRALKIGIYLGVATLFYFPVFLYSIMIILSFVLFTGSSLRKNLLFIYGFVLPVVIVGLYYFWNGGMRSFLIQFFYANFTLPDKTHINLTSLLTIAAVPSVFLLLALLRVFGFPSFTNFQTRTQQIMFIMLALNAVVYSLANTKAPYLLVLFVTPSAFFLTHYFLLIRKRIWTELQFLIFFSLVILVNWGSYYGFFFTSRFVDYDSLIVQESPLNAYVEGKKIVVFGQGMELYRDATLATPYLNWELSKLHLENLDYYDNLTAVYKNFREDMPDLIVDKENVMPKLAGKIPALEKAYRRTEHEGVYARRE